MNTHFEHPLTSYRRRAGLSLDELAQRAKTTKSWLSRIEGGTDKPGPGLIERLISASGGEISANDFFQPPSVHPAEVSP